MTGVNGLRRASIWSTLTLGALFGAFNLLVVHGGLMKNPPSHNQTHAGFQIWGFVFLFVASTSPGAAPRFVLWATLAAQALTAWGRVGDILPGAVPALIAGALLQLAAVLAWSRKEPGWLAAAALLVGGSLDALREGDPDASLRWAQAMYAVALFGAAYPWLLESRAAKGLSIAGAALMAAGLLLRRTPVVDVGLLAVAAAAVVQGRRMSLLFAALAGGYAVADLAVGASALIWDGARHVFTLGVLTLGILERSGARSPWGVRLLVAGVLLRQAQGVAALFAAPAWLWVSAFSGLIAAAGVLLAGRAILKHSPSSEPPR